MRHPAAIILGLVLSGSFLYSQSTDKSWRPSLATVLAMNEGGIVVVDSPFGAAWIQALKEPRLDDILERIMIRKVDAKDPGLTTLGLGNPGVHVLDPSGRLLGSFEGAPPNDLLAALESMGLRSRTEEFKGFLKQNPERVDVAWNQFERQVNLMRKRQSETVVNEMAQALHSLLVMSAWAEQDVVEEVPLSPLAPPDLENPMRMASVNAGRQ